MSPATSRTKRSPGAGDANGDGYADFVLGGSFAVVAGKTNAGAAHLILGRSTGFTHLDVPSPTPTQFGGFGSVRSCSELAPRHASPQSCDHACGISLSNKVERIMKSAILIALGCVACGSSGTGTSFPPRAVNPDAIRKACAMEVSCLKDPPLTPAGNCVSQFESGLATGIGIFFGPIGLGSRTLRQLCEFVLELHRRAQLCLPQPRTRLVQREPARRMRR
jgi:hypothetical protein